MSVHIPTYRPGKAVLRRKKEINEVAFACVMHVIAGAVLPSESASHRRMLRERRKDKIERNEKVRKSTEKRKENFSSAVELTR
jgi:hypothetical protein